MGHDYKLLTDCCMDFGGVKELNLCGNTIEVQPASDVSQACCCSIWQILNHELEREKKEIGPSTSIDDIFPSFAPNYRPQLFHYYVQEDVRVAVGWRVPCVSGRPHLKSFKVVLMMWNGIVADSKPVWQMLRHGTSPNPIGGLDIFLWGYITGTEKLSLENGKYLRSSRSISSLSYTLFFFWN